MGTFLNSPNGLTYVYLQCVGQVYVGFIMLSKIIQFFFILDDLAKHSNILTYDVINTTQCY